MFNNCWAFFTNALVDVNFVFDDFPKPFMFSTPVKKCECFCSCFFFYPVTTHHYIGNERRRSDYNISQSYDIRLRACKRSHAYGIYRRKTQRTKQKNKNKFKTNPIEKKKNCLFGPKRGRYLFFRSRAKIVRVACAFGKILIEKTIDTHGGHAVTRWSSR